MRKGPKRLQMYCNLAAAPSPSQYKKKKTLREYSASFLQFFVNLHTMPGSRRWNAERVKAIANVLQSGDNSPAILGPPDFTRIHRPWCIVRVNPGHNFSYDRKNRSLLELFRIPRSWGKLQGEYSYHQFTNGGGQELKRSVLVAQNRSQPADLSRDSSGFRTAVIEAPTATRFCTK